MGLEPCPGCGGAFAEGDGPTHPYMLSSPGCWARYGEVLAREYSHPELLATHRLSVDAYAVQHPGSRDDRRAVQSVGLHLARLMLQLDRPAAPRETNDAMLGLAKAKATLPWLEPPSSFALTVADIPLDGSFDDHVAAVRAWAADAWQAWEAHHRFIRTWAREALGGR
ncbi:MAG TPA: DUF5946 family protein [Allosphingosinicella sp.]|jgi:hypothetical protein